MYYTFYCNERMLLDNWQLYGECNKTLRRLIKLEHIPARCAAKEYVDKMKISNFYLTKAQKYYDYFKKSQTKDTFREISEVVIYKKDIEYVNNCRKMYGLSNKKSKALFGLIFFSRMLGYEWYNLDSEYRLRQFCGCFSESMKLISTPVVEHLDDSFSTPKELYELCTNDILEVRRVFDDNHNVWGSYRYPLWEVDANDEVGYIFTVTLENNRLNISDICDDLFDFDKKLCLCCGKEFAAAGRCVKWCPECAKKKNLENKNALYKGKYSHNTRKPEGYANVGRKSTIDHDKVMEMRRHGKQYGEIAQELGTKVDSVKKIIKRTQGGDKRS